MATPLKSQSAAIAQMTPLRRRSVSTASMGGLTRSMRRSCTAARVPAGLHPRSLSKSLPDSPVPGAFARASTPREAVTVAERSTIVLPVKHAAPEIGTAPLATAAAAAARVRPERPELCPPLLRVVRRGGLHVVLRLRRRPRGVIVRLPPDSECRCHYYCQFSRRGRGTAAWRRHRPPPVPSRHPRAPLAVPQPLPRLQPPPGTVFPPLPGAAAPLLPASATAARVLCGARLLRSEKKN